MRRYFRSTAFSILGLSRTAKLLIAFSVDICLCVLATWLAFFLRLDEFVKINDDFARSAFLSIGLALPIFGATGLYRAMLRFSGWPAIVAVGKAIGLYGLIYLTIVMVIGFYSTPRTIGIIQPLLLFHAVAGSRLFAGFWLGDIHRTERQKGVLPRGVIYGAGAAGRQLADGLSNGYEMQVIGFIDDDDRLQGRVLKGFPIFEPGDLSYLINSKGLTHILLAMPSVPRTRRNEILKYISHHKITVRTLPSMVDLLEGRVTLSDIRDLDIDDLLGRDSVPSNHILLTTKVSGKAVLVTGAGGSIGSELCRQILKLKPKKLLLVEISESALYRINSELEGLAEAFEEKRESVIVPLLASVQDEERMRDIIEIWQPETVYHAAAYKHVPLVEHNLAEGLKNNVFGTLTVARLAIEHNVSDFVLISSDKAVRPTNVMGASKRLAELCLQALQAAKIQKVEMTTGVRSAGRVTLEQSTTKLSMVRFGNVLDSSGSVIPKFRRQIHDGGPVTLTHPEITRYFMTIPEAAELVIQAGAMANGGDVFVLDMGEPIRIADLARSMIELSGLTVRNEENPEGDIEIVITGLRPGEKLFEELLLGDNPQPTQHSKIQRAKDAFMPWNELAVHLNSLRLALGHKNLDEIVSLLEKLVIGYQPHSDIVDWVYREQSRLGNGARDFGHTTDAPDDPTSD